MKFFLLLFLVISCGKVVEEKSSFPENNASPIETEAFKEALATIQADFNAINVNVDLNSIPYSINNLGSAAGICYKAGDGDIIGIALDHSLFERQYEDEDEYGYLYKVLLHEIGHCFFNRNHDEDYFKVADHDMMIRFYPNRKLDRHGAIAQSVMSELGFYQVPKTIWPYYLKEIAGFDRIKTWEDILKYTEIIIVPHNNN